jgi:hypothetical protein
MLQVLSHKLTRLRHESMRPDATNLVNWLVRITRKGAPRPQLLQLNWLVRELQRDFTPLA